LDLVLFDTFAVSSTDELPEREPDDDRAAELLAGSEPAPFSSMSRSPDSRTAIVVIRIGRKRIRHA
jgi:hypothetical protein